MQDADKAPLSALAAELNNLIAERAAAQMKRDELSRAETAARNEIAELSNAIDRLFREIGKRSGILSEPAYLKIERFAQWR
jgi:hypothetical protein